MSEVTHTISGTIPPIHKCCDKDSKKWATDGVQVSPGTSAGQDMVWLTATDCRILAITPVEGVAPVPVIAPAKVFAKRGGTKRHLPNITLNGEWRSAETVCAPVEGRFPMAHAVLPDVQANSGVRAVTLDIELLKNLADALKGDRDYVTLLIPAHHTPDGDIIPDERDSLCIDGAISVVGAAGIGVIMALGGGETHIRPHVQRYRKLRARYISDAKADIAAKKIADAQAALDQKADRVKAMN